MIKNKKIFITGGAGFIGSHLSKALIENSNQIVLFDNLKRNAAQRMLKDFAGKYELVQGDVTNYSQVEAELIKHQPTHIVHAAGIAGIDTVTKTPVQTMSVNYDGTANVLAASIHLPELERLVCLSTSEIFGANADKPNEFSDAVVGAVGEPRWVYAASKLAAEHLTFAYHVQHKIKAVSLRPFNVYGPAQVGEGALSAFIYRAIRDQDITIHNNGEQVRSWCYVDDMVQGITRALEIEEACGKAFNIGSPIDTLNMKDLAKLVIEAIGAKSKIIHQERAGADVLMRMPDIEYTKKILGFEPKTRLLEGIKLTAEDYRSQL